MSRIRIVNDDRCSRGRVEGVILEKPLTSGSILTPLLCAGRGAGSIPFVRNCAMAELGQRAVYIDIGRGSVINYVPCLSDCVCFSEGNVFIRKSARHGRGVPFFSKVGIGGIVRGRGLPVGSRAIVGATITLSAVFTGGSGIPSRVRFRSSKRVDLICKSVAIGLKGSRCLRSGVAEILTVLPVVSRGGKVLRTRGMGSGSGGVALRRRRSRDRASTRG